MDGGKQLETMMEADGCSVDGNIMALLDGVVCFFEHMLYFLRLILGEFTGDSLFVRLGYL